MRIKVWCSCIRSSLLKERLASNTILLPVNEAPKEGDLVVVRALTKHGVYTEVEDIHGRHVRLYAGDTFVGVFGTRKSGTNLTGAVPTGPVRKGDMLHLVANGGLIAAATFVPRYYGAAALTVEVQGFFPWDGGRSANLRDAQYTHDCSVGMVEEGRIIFVTGTSAESGKTTFVCEALQATKRLWPDLTAGAIKAAGTGRLQDMLRYADAGAAHITDFVDAGWPSTYNIPANDYVHMLDTLVRSSLQHVKVVFVETGGDLLEARVPEALAMASKWCDPVILVANDAMGAMAGLGQLRDLGIHNVTVVTMKQNQKALAERLQLPSVLDPLDERQLEQVIMQLLRVELTKRGASHSS